MFDDTITAIATPPGNGAIAVIRISGKKSFDIIKKIFKPLKGNLKIKHYSLKFGTIQTSNEIIDEVIVSFFKSPGSYTGEDSVEISCHGSVYIQQKILNIIIENGARLAKPGEFTQRAFLNGKIDLSQAEAVADLIASESASAHKTAINQMRGGFKHDLQKLRSKLLNFISLIELELDFSEEDVEFADRKELNKLISEIENKILNLKESFKLGNAIKNGVQTVIAGKPNAGKSTLLNALLNENRAIVSEIEGTTRDSIEEIIILSGIKFRFIDTAGLRKTENKIEKEGVRRTLEHLKKSSIYIYLFDINKTSPENLKKETAELPPEIPNIIVANKTDFAPKDKIEDFKKVNPGIIFISAKNKTNLNILKEKLIEITGIEKTNENDTVIVNARHYEILKKAYDAVLRIKNGIKTGLSGEFLAQDIREILNLTGEITGEFTTDEILGNIFANFCIGK